MGWSVLALLLLASARDAAATTADELCAPSADPCVVSTARTVTAGSVLDFGARELRVTSTGNLSVGSGAMTIVAGRVTLEGQLLARGTLQLAGGSITVTAGTINISGTIDAEGSPGGSVLLTTTGAFTLTGTITATARSAERDAGAVSINGAAVSLGGTISARAGDLAFGGSVDVVASADLTVTGAIDASGGEAGTIALTAGSGTSAAGNLTVGDGALVTSDSTVGGGSGGEISLDAFGDGVNTGNIEVRGRVRANGRTGTEDTGGGDGGLISLTAAGAVRSAVAATILEATGGGPDGEGGDVEVSTTAGPLTLTGDIDVRAVFIESTGGSISLDVAGDVTVSGRLQANGGGFDGGSVVVTSRAGRVTVNSTAMLFASSGTGGGFGGEVSINGGQPQSGSATVTVLGRLEADGSGGIEFSGDGGEINVTGRDEVRVQNVLSASGGLNGGVGGDIKIISTAGPLTISGPVNAKGNGAGGGSVNLYGTSSVTLSGEIDARGASGPGGEVIIGSAGSITLAQPVRASSTLTGNGGSVSAETGNGSITVNSIIETNAGPSGNTGGRNRLLACTISIASTGQLNATGPNGSNTLISLDSMSINGRLTAGARNELRYRTNPPQIGGSAVINPAVTVTQDTSLFACNMPTITPTPTITNTPTSTRTRSSTPTITNTPAATATRTETPAPSAPPTASPRPTRTPAITATPGGCDGDCDGDGRVTVDELVLGSRIMLGEASVSDCTDMNLDGNERITIDELVRALGSARDRCP